MGVLVARTTPGYPLLKGVMDLPDRNVHLRAAVLVRLDVVASKTAAFRHQIHPDVGNGAPLGIPCPSDPLAM